MSGRHIAMPALRISSTFSVGTGRVISFAWPIFEARSAKIVQLRRMKRGISELLGMAVSFQIL